jgi:flagellar protein FliO/FliZ
VLAQFGIEASRAAQYVIAFAIILALVALFGVVLRKLTGSRLMISGQDRGRSRQPRLGVVDIYDLDRQRQLVLLRRDNVEHLLLIGGLNDVVIETNIVRVAGARIPVAASDAGAERVEPSLDQMPRPAIEGSGRPSIETQLAAQLGAFIKRPSEESDADQELAPVASVSAPIPARPEPALKPDAVTVSVAPPPVPPAGVPGLRAEARSTAAPPPPPPVAEPRRPQPAAALTPAFPRPATPAVQAAAPLPSPAPEIVRAPQAAPAARRDPDAAVLSDMAKQLEEALKRPAGPVPPPAPPANVRTHPVHEDVVDEDELLEPAEPEHRAVEPDHAAFEEEPGDDGRTMPGRPPAEPIPLRPAMDPVRPPSPPPPPPSAQPAPAPLPAQPAPPPLPAQAAPPPPAAEAPAAPRPAAKAPDPFSVEEIEAEFARLLGRPLDGGKRE